MKFRKSRRERRASVHKGNNQDSISEQNRSLVISLILQNGVCSRTQLSRQTGLKPATITNIVNELFDWGLIRESDKTAKADTRRSVGLEINSNAFYVLGVRVSRMHYSVGLFNLAGELLDDNTSGIGPGMTADGVMDDIIRICDQLMLRHSRIMVMGIALPGPLSKKEGRIIYMSGFPGWERIDILAAMQQRYPIPVVMDHDANASVLAEKWFGGHKADTIVFLTLGGGIGCGVLSGDRIFDGAFGMAGEVGHMSICFDGPKCGCGNRGCLELYCSTIQVLKRMERYLDRYPDSVLRPGDGIGELARAVHLGDELALKIFTGMADRLSVGVTNVVNIYNPNLIILGDEMARIGEPLLNAVKERIRDSMLPKVHDHLKIALSSFDTDPGYIGACALGLEHIVRKPNDIRRKANTLS